ncbi:hypothetical protein VSA01S_34310 [Vibrio sagamiensis NBRC 104589]|uniref:Uncharacterized protein n=1 Tax=Vibrio sagamiensis NBRC 104589 TaxID=1219064 RepID=A0A511QJ64_9VIBR|nr:hypothetical protein VSA01S_34310 [Vibrio sagamiensis NBRC 104589]
MKIFLLQVDPNSEPFRIPIDDFFLRVQAVFFIFLRHLKYDIFNYMNCNVLFNISVYIVTINPIPYPNTFVFNIITG